MDDDRIRNLFSDFRPDLTSSDQFMSQLRRNLEIIEIVKQQNLALRRRNRIAVAIAAVCGFVTGVILTLTLPLAGDWILTFNNISLPQLSINTLNIDYRFLYWIIMGGVCVITSMNAYEIAMVKLKESKA